MSDGELRSTWRWTLFRYLFGPVLAVGLMVLLILWNLSSRTAPWSRSEPTSPQYQTMPEGRVWQPFTRKAWRQSLDESRAVLVHFVDSGPKSLENRNVLCRQPRLQLLFEQGRVVPMLANLSDLAKAPEAAAAYATLSLDHFPVIAIYLPGAEEEPTLFERSWTEPELLDVVRNVSKTSRPE